MSDQVIDCLHETLGLDPYVSGRIYRTAEYLRGAQINLEALARLVEHERAYYRDVLRAPNAEQVDLRVKWFKSNKDILKDALLKAEISLGEATPYLTRKQLNEYTKKLNMASQKIQEIRQDWWELLHSNSQRDWFR